MIVLGQLQFETEYIMTIIDGEDNSVLNTDSVFVSCNLEPVVFLQDRVFQSLPTIGSFSITECVSEEF